jgi:hypothetical protein
MAVACGVSFGLCAVRVTVLDEDGVALGGAGNTYTSDKATTISLSPNISTGNTFELRNGCGCSVSRFKDIDVFNWFEFSFSDGALEPEMMSMMMGSTGIADAGDQVGMHFGSALTCSDAEPTVAFEFWTKHLNGNTQDATHPWIHWVFPKTIWQLGDNTAENDYLQTALSGFSRANPIWGSGPYGDGPPDGSDVNEGAFWKTNVSPPTADCVSGSVTPGS